MIVVVGWLDKRKNAHGLSARTPQSKVASMAVRLVRSCPIDPPYAVFFAAQDHCPDFNDRV